MITIETFPVGLFQCNCSIVSDSETGDALIVDPGDEAEKIIARVQKQGLNVAALVHTHAHIDHVGATAVVANRLQTRACLHVGDKPLYDHLDEQSRFLNLPADPERVQHWEWIGDGQEISTKTFGVSVLHTPGHTPGSVCFHLREFGSNQDPVVFSGDTLFYRSIGRTDLWGGDFAQIQESIRTKLLTLPPQTQVIPGHGPVTKIADEGQQNPFLKNLF